MREMIAWVIVAAVLGTSVAHGEEAKGEQLKIERMPFSDLFQMEQGKVSVKRPVRLASGPVKAGGTINCGSAQVQDVDLCTLAGRDLAVVMDGQTPVVKGYFKE